MSIRMAYLTHCSLFADKRNMGPIHPLRSLAASALIDAKVANLDRPLGDDLSYTLIFRGPVLQCREVSGTSLMTLHQTDFQSLTGHPTGDKYRQLKEPIPTYRLSWASGRLSLRPPTRGENFS